MSASHRQSSEELIEVFRGLIEKYGILLDINRKVESIPDWGIVSLDVEHDEKGNFVGIGICHEQSCIYWTEITEEVKQYIENRQLICHNGRSDFDCLRQWGIDVKDEQLYWDTELISHIIDSSRRGYGLKKLAESDLGIHYPSYDDIVGKRTAKQKQERCTLDKHSVELVSAYNAMDTFSTWKLYEQQVITQQSRNLAVTSTAQYFEEIERPIGFILSQMEARGICVDLQYLQGLKTSLEAQQIPIEAEIKNELGAINLNSPKQLLEALNAKEIYPTFKGKASTDKRALQSLSSNEIIEKLLAYSEIDTLLSSFVLSYLERGQCIVHPWFNQCGTRTGRLSCSNPNLLQIPRRTENGKLVRRMFKARDGMLMGDCDFGQIEPRVLAHLSKDPVLCEMFNNGTDFHDYTAKRLGISRDRAKVLNLSVGYRATKYSVQRQLGGTLEEAQMAIDQWWNLFPALRRWQDSILFQSKRSGFVTTLLGRRIKVDNLNEGNFWKREAAERQAINNITQGSAAEIMKMAMIKISQTQLTPKFGLLVQVYDELLFESNEIDVDSLIVKDCMENAIKLDVPLTVDCKMGETWADCH